MADIFYGLDRGDTEFDVVQDTSSPTKDVEVVVDDAVSLTKEEVVRALDMIKNHIIKNDNYQGEAMSHAQAVTLASDVDAAGTGEWVFYPGGAGAIVSQATSYGTTVNVEMKGPDGNAIVINSATIDEDAVTGYDYLPAGEYRYTASGGTTTDLYIVIARVPQ